MYPACAYMVGVTYDFRMVHFFSKYLLSPIDLINCFQIEKKNVGLRTS